MKRIDIKITFACNNKCKFCVQGDKRLFYSDKSQKKIITFLKHAAKTYDSVVFTGGEPTVRSDFIDLVRIVNSLGFAKIQIQTNGRMFSYRRFCVDMINAGANEFSPAVHGHSAEIHDFLTSSTGSFRQTIQGIKNLKALGQYVLTNTVITTYNYKFLPEIAKLLVNLGVDQFQFAFSHIVGTAYKNKDWLIPKKSQVIDYIKRGLDIGIKANKRVMTEAIPFCFMRGYEEYIAERIIPETKIFDADLIINNYSAYRKQKGKAKRTHCNRCKYDSICEGPWKEYPQIFGWDEFIPIQNI